MHPGHERQQRLEGLAMGSVGQFWLVWDKHGQNRLCWFSRLNKVPLGVTKDGALAEQSVRAFAGARLRTRPLTRPSPVPHAWRSH